VILCNRELPKSGSYFNLSRIQVLYRTKRSNTLIEQSLILIEQSLFLIEQSLTLIEFQCNYVYAKLKVVAQFYLRIIALWNCLK